MTTQDTADNGEIVDRERSVGPFGLMLGTERLIVGVEDDREDPSLLRVYIDHRGECRYVLVSDPEDQERVRRAWANTWSHLTMPTPDGYYVDEEQKAENRRRFQAEVNGHSGSDVDQAKDGT